MTKHQKKFKLKAGDPIIVISGKNKNKTGIISEMLREKDRAIISGINMVKKHNKAQHGGIIEKPASIHISNIAYYHEETGAAKIGYKIHEGKKVRFLKANDHIIGDNHGK